MKLSEYNYSIEYMSGSQNLVSDALSRGPVETAVEPEVASLHIFSIINTTDWIAAKQRDSAEVASIISKLDENDGTVVDKYAMEDGRLYRYRTTKVGGGYIYQMNYVMILCMRLIRNYHI